MRGLREVGLLGLALLRGPGCGEIDSPPSRLNAPCTREDDCQAHLTCKKGVCVDGDATDAGDDAARD